MTVSKPSVFYYSFSCMNTTLNFFFFFFYYSFLAEANMSLDSLKALYLRPLFAVYFGVLNLITFSGLFFSIYVSWLSSNDQRRTRLIILRDLCSSTMNKLVGICMSVVGGLLASETLLLAKSG